MKPIITALMCLAALSAQANGSFNERCEKLAAEATIRVLFEDKPITRDDSHNVDELTRLAGSGITRFHSVLGLTHAVPSASMEFTTRFLNDGEGGTCAVPLATLKLGFSSLDVNLAREITNPCRRQIVEEHEQEHVAVWRDHLRIGARLLAIQLTNAYGRPDYFRSPDDANQILRERIEQHVSTALKELEDGIMGAHQQIDSQGSYRQVENRMRACP
jgi:hypothetical protein